MRYWLRLIVLLMVGAVAMAGFPGSAVAAYLAPEEYKEYVIKALAGEPKAIQHLTVDATAFVPLPNQMVNAAVQGTFDIQAKPVAGKGEFKASFSTQSTKHEIQVPLYLEQAGDYLDVYFQFEGKWFKKKAPVPKMKEVNRAEILRKTIKSVSLVGDSNNSFVFEVVENYKDNPELLKQLANEQLKPFLDVLGGDLKYRVTVDKNQGAVTKVSFDLSKLVAKVGAMFGQAMKMPDTGKEAYDKALAGCKLNIEVGIAKSDLTPPIRLPLELATATELVDTVGYVDLRRVFTESATISTLRGQIAAKSKEVSQQLAAEKDLLSEEEYAQRKAELQREAAAHNRAIAAKINKLIGQAFAQVKKERNLTNIVTSQKFASPLATVVDVTDAVVRTIEAAAE